MTMTWVAFFSGAVIGGAFIAFVCFIWACVLDWQDMRKMEGGE